MADDFVTIKGRANDTLEIILSDDAPYSKIRENLLYKLEKNKAFFDGAQPRVVVRSKKLPRAQQQDIRNVMLMDYGIGDVLFDERLDDPAPEQTPAAAEPQARRAQEGQSSDAPQKSAGRTQLVSTDYFDARSVIVSHTVRSGQRIECEGDIVVLGDVNPGAELIAAGSIVVMGALRGLAHAGATGRKDVVISALRLKPVQLRISSKATVFPENTDEPAGPEIAQYRDGHIVIRPLAAKKP